MRLAIVSAYPPNPQGEADYVERLIRALAKRDAGLDILVLAQKQAGAEVDSQPLPNVHVLRVVDSQRFLHKHLSFFQILRALRNFKPDVVHFSPGMKQDYGGIMGEPLLLCMLGTRLLGKPSLLSLHNSLLRDDIATLCREKGLGAVTAWIFRNYYTALLKLQSRLVSLISFVSAGDNPSIFEELMRLCGCSRQKATFESHPCESRPTDDARMSAAKQALGIGGCRVVLTTGFVRRDKGLHILLQSASRLLPDFDDVVVAVAGQPQRPQYHSYANELKTLAGSIPERARILLEFRYLTGREFDTYLDAADIVVVPYLRAPGPSGPIHHALSKGKAVIASDVGHNRGLHGVCLLVPPAQPAALEAAIRSLLTDPEKLAQIRMQAMGYAKEHSWDRLATTYFAHFRYLLSGKSVPPALTAENDLSEETSTKVSPRG
jgi:glycosyltransferase involved in cell wall biosynthesis